jgi:hypothetical protein
MLWRILVSLVQSAWSYVVLCVALLLPSQWLSL